MNSYQKFLFYWSFIVATVLLVVCLFFIPKPQSFFALALFTPVPLYFWLKVTLEGENNPYRWSLKILSVLLVAGILGIFAFWLAGKTPNQPPKTTPPETISPPTQTVLGEKDSEDIKRVLEEIKTEISQIKAEQRATREILEISGSAKDIANIINTILELATGSALPAP